MKGPHRHAQEALWRRRETEGMPILSPPWQRLSTWRFGPGWSMLSASDFSMGNLIPAFLVARTWVFLRGNIARRVGVNGNKVRGFE